MRAGATAKKPAKPSPSTPATNSQKKSDPAPNQQNKSQPKQTSKPASQPTSTRKTSSPAKTTSVPPKINAKTPALTQTQTRAPNLIKPTISKQVILYPTYDLKPNFRQYFFINTNQPLPRATFHPKTLQLNVPEAIQASPPASKPQQPITTPKTPSAIVTPRPFSPKPADKPLTPANPLTLTTFLSKVAGDLACDIPALRQTATLDAPKPPTTSIPTKPSKTQLLTTRNLTNFYRVFLKNPEHPQIKALITKLQQTNQPPIKIITGHPLLRLLPASIGEKNFQSLATSLQQIFRSETFTQLDAAAGRGAAIKISFAMHALSALAKLSPAKIANGYLVIGGIRISVAFLSRLNAPQKIFSFIYISVTKTTFPQTIQNAIFAGPAPISPHAFTMLAQNAQSSLDIFTILFAGAFYLSTTEEEKKRKKLESPQPSSHLSRALPHNHWDSAQ